MADRYVSALAVAGTGTELDPWTLAEAVTAINDATVANGETVWVKADGTYTTAGIIISSSGATNHAKRFLGYTSTIGDGGKATIQRSGGAGILLDWNGHYWNFGNLVLDGQDSGTVNCDSASSSTMTFNVESKNAGTNGFSSGNYINCYAHHNGGYGWYVSQVAIFCIAANNTSMGYRGVQKIVNSIGKDNTSYNFYTYQGQTMINCVSDGGSSHGIAILYGGIVINCVCVNSPAGFHGLYFTTPQANRGPNYVHNIDFYGNDSDSNALAFIDTYYTLDPQFNNAAALDYTRTGTNLDDKGFSEIGMIAAADYNIDIGPDQKAGADYPAEADVEDGVVFDNGDKTGTFEAPAESDVKDGVTYGSAAEFEGDVELPAEADVESSVGYGSGGTEYEGELVISRVESPISLKVQDDRVILEVENG